MRVNFQVIRLLPAIATIISAAPVFASDGQLEINQACAVNTGCFPGDAPGFPVTIIQPGSYRLTGSLDLSAEGDNVSGVAVSAPAVTVDLGGFHIAGATTCSGSGVSISCSPSSTGVGSAGVQFTSNATAGVVQNGIVRNMTNFGILSQATGLRVRDVTAIHNGRDGITGRQGALVVNSVAIENGQDGIDVNTGSVVDGVTAIGNGSNGIRGQGIGSVVTRTSVQHNGTRGYFLGIYYKFGKNNASSNNVEADRCGGGICTESKRMYFTNERIRGDAVMDPGTCTLGFRVASKTDFFDIGRYVYDQTLGVHGNVPGPGGMPLWGGWVRPPNVNIASPETHPDNVSCQHWASSDPGHTGTYLSIRGPKLDGSTPNIGQQISVVLRNCQATESVVCVELP